MKIKNAEKLEECFAEQLRIIKDPNSTAKQILAVYDGRWDLPQDLWALDDKGFRKHVIQPLVWDRIKVFIENSKTYEEVLLIYKNLPYKAAEVREIATLKALTMADCKNALKLYCLVRFGDVAKQTLETAARLAKTQDELWQVAVHSKKCGNEMLWQGVIKRLALTL